MYSESHWRNAAAPIIRRVIAEQAEAMVRHMVEGLPE